MSQTVEDTQLHTAAQTQTSEHHVPVMLETCLEHLQVQPQRWYVDATFGAGGHSRALLKTGANVMAIDQDPLAQQYARAIPLAEVRFRFLVGNFRTMDTLVARSQPAVQEIWGVLLDLGVSSMQLDQAERGFAFRHEGALDMRMSQTGLSAADVVNEYSQEDLANIIYRYGEERHSRRIARKIVEERAKKTITTTEELTEIIFAAYPSARGARTQARTRGGTRSKRRDHPARRTFQALRIHVNDELAALEDALAAAERLLCSGGRLVVMSYHSLEDRIVKHHFKESLSLDVITKKPSQASEQEITDNPRARSAKLRVAQKRAEPKALAFASHPSPALYSHSAEVPRS